MKIVREEGIKKKKRYNNVGMEARRKANESNRRNIRRLEEDDERDLSRRRYSQSAEKSVSFGNRALLDALVLIACLISGPSYVGIFRTHITRVSVKSVTTKDRETKVPYDKIAYVAFVAETTLISLLKCS